MQSRITFVLILFAVGSGIWKQPVSALVPHVSITFVVPADTATASVYPITAVDDGAFPLDLSSFFTKRFAVTGDMMGNKFGSYIGRQTVDGLPFNVDGECLLWGFSRACRNHVDPTQLTGIQVDRTFEELHLVHCAEWHGYYNALVATIRLNYADGTHFDFEIRYGKQVIDWQRLTPEEQENLDDPGTKIILRGRGTFQPCSSRLFTTVFINPHPEIKVQTIDVISAKTAASYDLMAATVSDTDPSRAVNPALPTLPSRNFDGQLKVHFVDDKGAPVVGAEVYPYETIDDYGLAADTILTGKDGTIVVKYPTKKATEIDLAVPLGYQPIDKALRPPYPAEVTYQLLPLK